MPPPPTVASALASVSSFLFPDMLGEARVEVNSRRSNGDTPLHIIAWWGDVEGAKLLIAAGADVNAAGDMGETPLHNALIRRDEQMARLLVRAGADVNQRSEFDRTPWEMAERMGGEAVGWLRTNDVAEH